MAGKEKNEQKNVSGVALLYTLALIAAAIGLIVVSSLLLPGIGRAMRPPGSDHFEVPPEGDIAPLQDNFYITLALSAVNVLLAVYLLYTYVKNYLAIKSSFTLGVVAFLFSFMLYALSSLPMHMLLGPYGVASRLSFVPMLFSAIGLLIFAKLGSE